MTPPEISEAQWQPHLIVGIEDREFRFEPRELGVAPQHLGADRVKRARFVWKGFGTPAPIAPPTKLVMTGFYRRVRNPIYVGLVTIVFGEALILGDARLVVYAAILWLFFHFWVLVIEEPTLERSFGDEFANFKANVPRWLPRPTPWAGSAKDQAS
jgi:Phospholipid methyltransferase